MKRSDLIKIILVLILLAPTGILLSLAASSLRANSVAPSFILPIRGYDPRDLVFGHYFQFQIDWPWRQSDPITCDTANTDDCRVCLQVLNQAPAPTIPAVAIIPKDDVAKEKCAATLDGISYFHIDKPPILALKNEVRRFYIDENHGKSLDDYFRDHAKNFSVLVKVRNGQLYVEDLLIDGRRYQDALQAATPKSSAP